MLEPVGWEDVDVRVTAEALERVEKAWGVRLPVDFTQCVQENNGGCSSRDVFDVSGRSRVFNRLFRFNADSDSYVLDCFEDMQDRLVDRVFPIADDVFGNAICLDYRQDRENPSIVFWDHEVASQDPEAAVAYIAASFTEFLQMLRSNDFDPTLYLG